MIYLVTSQLYVQFLRASSKGYVFEGFQRETQAAAHVRPPPPVDSAASPPRSSRRCSSQLAPCQRERPACRRRARWPVARGSVVCMFCGCCLATRNAFPHALACQCWPLTDARQTPCLCAPRRRCPDFPTLTGSRLCAVSLGTVHTDHEPSARECQAHAQQRHCVHQGQRKRHGHHAHPPRLLHGPLPTLWPVATQTAHQAQWRVRGVRRRGVQTAPPVPPAYEPGPEAARQRRPRRQQACRLSLRRRSRTLCR